MSDVLEFNGTDISDIPVINRPSYFLVNNYGRESYMTILEPVEEFKRTTERAVLAGAYKSVSQLVAAFKEKAPEGNKDSGYNRKDTVEVFFMGFRWRWRPNHKSYYGNITVGYELLPLIARWIALTGASERIDNKSESYLPMKYKGGTARGFGGADIDIQEDDVSPTSIAKEVADFRGAASGAILNPILHSFAGSVTRASQLNIVPREAYDIYDGLMESMWSEQMMQFKAGMKCNYAIKYTDNNGETKFLGALYGGAKIPQWADILTTKEVDKVKVTIININAETEDQAEELMRGLLRT